MSTAVVRTVSIFPLSIPLRRKVEHAQAAREASDNVVVKVEFVDGTVGFGETLARDYVTGESVNSVIDALKGPLLESALAFRAERFSEALNHIENLPCKADRHRPIPAARAALELALLDAAMKHYGRNVDDVARWMGLPGFGTPGSLDRIRFSGVLASSDPVKTLKLLRLMYWTGFRHFKLKVGDPGDDERIRLVAGYLHRPLKQGTASLRIDANGAWTKDEAIERLGDWRDIDLAAVEQPLARAHDADLPVLHDLFEPQLLHDESLVTLDDARRLEDLGVADGFNIRISKCGGLLPALRLAGFAHRVGARIVLGCMVGETSILAAAGLQFLRVCPTVAWAEGCFGSWLLDGDVVRRPLKFSFAGRPPRLASGGLGLSVEEGSLHRWCHTDPTVINLG